ncbi:MAG: adenine phosphoribosyltransferase [Candidatus Delongbacteria bacterium]|nr:adenine phosphoribosyltransferase [Candidatus Delongbacteria bacterium]
MVPKSVSERLRQSIRTIADFPKPGIMFRDITTLLQNPEAFSLALTTMQELALPLRPQQIIGTESRGFIFAAPLALKLQAGFVPVRKPGKLPAATISVTYELEYGTDELEIHTDAIRAGERVLLVDDLLATGGTIRATCNLVEQLGGVVVGCIFLVELDFLQGRRRLEGFPVYSLVNYESEND